MKVAIIHDWLGTKVGGAEFVFFELASHYPEADLFALTYNRSVFRPYLGKRKVATSFLQYMPAFVKSRPQFMLPFVRRAVKGFDLSGYDLVISNSTAWVKNITVPEGTKHFSYCHSPARMLWDSWPKYLEGQKIGPFRVGAVSKFFITKLASKLRLWDFYATEDADLIAGNSAYVVGRIKKYYGVHAEILYPPVEPLKAPDIASSKPDEPYYLVLSVLSRYKNVELAVEAFKGSSRNLVVAGSGPDSDRLKALAKGAGNISFVGRVSDERKVELMAGAQAFIFPSIEDFGITPVEAMSVGTPVIALRGGGLLETVLDGVSGLFFDGPRPDSLAGALGRFEKMAWDKNKIKETTQKFSPKTFHALLDHLAQRAMKP